MTKSAPRSSHAPAAVAMSGGGGRAAAFHLGTLSCLDRIDVLKDVSTISSVSGGTFTAAKYALTLKTAPASEDLHTTFRRFFREFYDFMLKAELVPRALERVAAGPPDTPSPRRTMVKALADVYDRTFMNGARFDIFWGSREIHLKNLVFNSTECKNGRAFRFQKTERPLPVGNSMVWIDVDHARRLRLADIVAASSDIPVGLEPMVFPQDFVWPAETPDMWKDVRGHLSGNFGIEELALMDGGVIDNQGVEGALIAAFSESMDATADAGASDAASDDLARYLRTVDALPGAEGGPRGAEWLYECIPRQEQLGLIVISDVPSMSDVIYAPDLQASLNTAVHAQPRGRIGVHLPGGFGRWLTLGRMNVIAWVITVLAGARMIDIISRSIAAGGPRWSLGALWLDALPLVFAASVFAVFLAIRLEARKAMRKAATVAPNLWQCLKRLSVDDIIYMIESRITSTWAMTSTIFLNRIRRLMYYAVYKAEMPTPGTGVSSAGAEGHPAEGLRSRIAPCEIYDIGRQHPGLPDWLEPTPRMRDLARRAAAIPTTLWLSRDQLEDLIVCGQMTACFRMAQYCAARKGESEATDLLLDNARQLWETLKEDNRALLTELLTARAAAKGAST